MMTSFRKGRDTQQRNNKKKSFQQIWVRTDFYWGITFWVNHMKSADKGGKGE